MHFLEYQFTVEPRDPWSDLIADELGSLGFDSFEETENGLSAFMKASEEGEPEVSEMEILKTEGIKVSWEVYKVESKNWNELWEKNFDPITVGNRCLVRATFHKKSGHYEYEIVIDPKMSFGTGHHATTALILEAILDLDVQEKSVLDMGCGTAVLAILAAQKGATKVLGIDNDEWAYNNAVENINRNDVPHVELILGDASALGEEPFNIILANINKNVILSDLEIYSNALTSGGTLLLSGFFTSDTAEVRDHAESRNLEFVSQAELNGWARMRFTKN